MQEDKNKLEEPIKLEWKDILAIMIAQFQILAPIALGAIIVMTLLMVFFLKVWIK
jgi:hypothetical protein